MASAAGNARLAGAGLLKAAAEVWDFVVSSFATASPEVTGELLAGNVAPGIAIPPGVGLGDMSSQGVAVRAADQAGGQQTGQAGQDFFKVESLLAVVLGDQVLAHGTQKHGTDPTMIEGLSWFRINGIPVCRQGNKADCGHATTGRSWWHLNG